MGSSVILPPPGQPKTGPDPTFKSAALPNQVTFGFNQIGPPSPLYVQRDDVLVCNAIALAGDTVTFNIRLLQVPFPQGAQPAKSGADPAAGLVTLPAQIVSGQVVISLPTPGTFTQKFQILSEGYLLGVTALDSGTVVSRGATFARAWLSRGTAPGQTQAFQLLFADYVTVNSPIGWPGARTLYPTDGSGNIKEYTVANPAAGADWTVQFGPTARERIISANAQLLTSAAVANRIVRAQLLDGAGNLVYQGPPNQVIAAGVTAQVSISPATNQATTDTTSVGIPLPPGPHLTNQTGASVASLKTVTLNLQAGDQWSNIRVLVEEWVDNV